MGKVQRRRHRGGLGIDVTMAANSMLPSMCDGRPVTAVIGHQHSGPGNVYSTLGGLQEPSDCVIPVLRVTSALWRATINPIIAQLRATEMVGADSKAVLRVQGTLGGVTCLEDGHIPCSVNERQRSVTRVRHLAQVIQR